MAQHCLLNKVARTNTHYQVGLQIPLKPGGSVSRLRPQVLKECLERLVGEAGAGSGAEGLNWTPE